MLKESDRFNIDMISFSSQKARRRTSNPAASVALRWRGGHGSRASAILEYCPRFVETITGNSFGASQAIGHPRESLPPAERVPEGAAGVAGDGAFVERVVEAHPKEPSETNAKRSVRSVIFLRTNGPHITMSDIVVELRTNMRVLALCGSLQSKSSNLELLQIVESLAPPGVEIVVYDGLRDLPHFDPDLEATGEPETVRRWRKAIAGSDALFIASPEYGHSLPGVLKNAIDWVIGSGELEGKIVAITASVPHPERGRRGLGALRDTLGAVSADVVGGEPIARGATFEAQVKDLVDRLVERVRARAGGA
jgi:NAD(P)H-dependent FMN reductase